MPLSTNETTNKTAGELVDTIRGLFGTPQDQRPAHAKGQLTKGTFVPTKEAALLSTAPIFHQPSTSIIARLSSSTGIPGIPDSNPAANPRGFAVRFVLSEDGHTHYDIITHAKNGFATRTGEEFLEFLNAMKSGTADQFLATHPDTKAFNELPVGFPESFATEQFFGVHAFKFINEKKETVFFRYRIVPEDGEVKHIDSAKAEAQGTNYLYEELTARLTTAHNSVRYKLVAQIAEKDDPTDDATKPWPETRKFITLGVIELNQLWEMDESDAAESKLQKRLIMDPVPRQIQGIEASDDPLIDMRATIYLISGKKRREASGVA